MVDYEVSAFVVDVDPRAERSCVVMKPVAIDACRFSIYSATGVKAAVVVREHSHTVHMIQGDPASGGTTLDPIPSRAVERIAG